MSSRVPYIVGNTSGRDHIYWPTLTQAEYDVVVAGGTMPNTLKLARRPSCTLAQIMACCWRVKEWRFSGGWSLTASGIAGNLSISSTVDNTPTPNAITMRTSYPENDDSSFNFPVIHDVTDEAFIASGFLAQQKSPKEYITDYDVPLRNFGFIATLHTGNEKDTLNMNRTFGGDDNSAAVFFFGDKRLSGFAKNDGGAAGDWGDSRGMDIVIFEGGVFKPLFRWNDFASNGGGVDFECKTAQASQTPTDVFTIDPVVEPSFTAPLLIKPTTGTTVSTACDLTMTAFKFFPYKNSAGLPVYDEDTGAQLRDPFG